MLTLISTILGYIVSGLPKLLEFFQDRSDKKHELQILGLQKERELELQKAGFQIQREIQEISLEGDRIDASIREREALYHHDEKIGEGASTWVINLRASVRPVITYGMFTLLLLVDGFAAWYAYYLSVDFRDAITIIWNSEAQALWGSIVAFWFGSQQFHRKRS